MYTRLLTDSIRQLSKQYPVVTVVGPRQSGKSTICSLAFPDLAVFNLESPDIRARILADPKSFIDSQKTGCIIDEIQYLPELCSYIQVAVDGSKKKGQFILTGSQQYQLMESVTQSLAGRTAIVRLLPLSQEELQQNNLVPSSSSEQIIKGSYPRVYADKLDASQAYSFYIQTYLERDVRKITNVQDLTTFERFLRLCAGRSGQLLNASNLGADAGIDQSTVRRWINILESSLIMIKVAPFSMNLNKRLIKTPKLYFLDTGVLCNLLGIETAIQLETHPLRGAIFETYVVSEVIKYFYNRVKIPNIYFFRDRIGNEVDLVIEEGSILKLLEIKSGSSFANDWLKGINYVAELGLSSAVQRFLVYNGQEQFKVQGTAVLPLTKLTEVFSSN